MREMLVEIEVTHRDLRTIRCRFRMQKSADSRRMRDTRHSRWRDFLFSTLRYLSLILE